MITKLITSGLKRTSRPGFMTKSAQLRLWVAFSNDHKQDKPVASSKSGERWSQYESTLLYLNTFKENLERNKTEDSLTFDLARLLALCENLETKSAQQLEMYTKLPVFHAFQNKINEKLTQFNERGIFN